jgi:YVTN family beta-propeller protein
MKRWLIFAVCLIAVVPVLGASKYHLLKKIPLGGEGGWDYLVFDNGRLYIARATQVIVLDTASDKVAGDIPDTPGVHGIALAHELGRGFTSNGRGGNVTIFDLKTLSKVGSVKTGENPDAIVFDPASKRVFTFNGRSHDATAIDAATGNVAATVPLDGKPEFAVSDGKGRIFVNLQDKSEELVIDSKKLTVVSRWKLAPCEEPTGLAMDHEHGRLFVGCLNQLMAVVDADNGKVIATLPIGRGVDATAFDAKLQYAYASTGEGTLTVVHEDSPDKFSVVETVPTQRGARTMALDSETHNVYLVTADYAPPAPSSSGQPPARPSIIPNTFVVLVYGQ